MSVGVGVGDLVSAVNLAWTVYSSCQVAPSQFKALSEEVEALHLVLESIKEAVLDAGLDANKTNDLNRVSRGCITILTELDGLMDKYKSLGTSSRRTWDRLRWGQEQIEPLRRRLIANVSLLSAFNSSLVHASQTTIITRLDRVLTDMQEGRSEMSSVSNLDTELRVWDIPLTRELDGEPSLPLTMLEEAKSTFPRIDSAFNEAAWQIDVVSATYGTSDVTNHIQRFFRAHNNNVQAFVPSNAFFGGVDPIPNSVKAFVLVWRMALPYGDSKERSYSAVQTERCLEGQVVSLQYDTPLPPFIPPAILPQSIQILDATYYTLDVTAVVARLVDNHNQGPWVVRASNVQFGSDPAFNTVKQLSITYAYRSYDGSFENHTQVVSEGGTITITIPLQPLPQLIIHAAYWADLDVTHILRSRVSHDQTLQIDTSSIHSFDPWYNVSKTLSIMYQYTNGPLQLIVRYDSSGIIFIGPTRPLQRHFLNPARRHASRINILAVIWGAMHDHPEPLSASQFNWIAEKRKFPCTNEWFKFDGRPNWHKTCHVFYELGTTGSIRCIAAREGEECCLSDMPL